MGTLDLTNLVQLEINENLRNISIPKKGVVFGVDGDIEVNRVAFILPKYYSNFDMTEFSARVNYVNANGEANYYEATDMAAIDDETAIFSWLMTSDVTSYIGEVRFSVHLYKQIDDKYIQKFGTRPATGKVLEGLDVESYVTPEQQQTLLEKMESRFDEYVQGKLLDIAQDIDRIKNEALDEIEETKNDVDSLVENGKSEISSLLSSALDDIKDFSDERKQEISTLTEGKLVSIDDETAKQLKNIELAGTTETEKIKVAFSSAVLDIQKEGQKQVSSVQSEGTKQVQNIGAAKDSSLKDIGNAKTDAIKSVNDQTKPIVDKVEQLKQNVNDKSDSVNAAYEQMQKLHCIEISEEEPTNDRAGLWVNPENEEEINIPEIKDDEVNNVDTWSSQKINDEVTSIKVPVDELSMLVYGINIAIQKKEFEQGSINSGNGSNVNPDAICIRTQEKKSYKNTIVVTNKKTDLYRIKYYIYTLNGSFVRADSDWHLNISSFEFIPEANYLYRFQIATRDGSTISLNDALENISFKYNDNKNGLSGRVDVLEASQPKPIKKYLKVNNLNTGETMDEIPSYWQDYLDEKIKDIRRELRNGSDKTCFMILTDTHYYGRDLHNINGAILKYVASKTNCTRILHLGDINSENSDPNIAVDFMQEPIRILRNVFKDVLVVRGNHDDNQEGSRGWNDSRISQSDSYSYMFRGMDVVFGETKTYFYQDDISEKVRYIALDSSDISYVSSDTWQKMLAFRTNQLTWLCKALENTPSGYSIIILLHSMLAPSNVTRENLEKSVQTRAFNYLAVCEILKAFKNKISNFSLTLDGNFSNFYSDEYNGTITADFSKSDSEIIGVFSGHEHVDCVEDILDIDGNSIGIKNTCTQNSSSMFPNTIISKSYQNPMEIGTTTEYIYDFIIIDKEQKNVKMIRIGAGSDREWSY